MATVPSAVAQFYIEDQPRTLFPMNTTTLIISQSEEKVREYLLKCSDINEPSYSILPQTRVYASKSNLHLRRTVKLDPVAEYYIYDVVYRNRTIFRKPHTNRRRHFGYRFESGKFLPPTDSYEEFRSAISAARNDYKHFISFDVASYFNSIYHHDLASWFAGQRVTDDDRQGLDEFLRKTNSGRSIDCLPQGLYATKMIGNEFLRFIDDSMQLNCSLLLRFMDDFYIFSDSPQILEQDFIVIQRLLGDKGLSINASKTHKVRASHIRTVEVVSDAKAALLEKRRELITSDYDGEDDFEIQIPISLDQGELDLLTNILHQDSITEEDAELILRLMRAYPDEVEERFPYFLTAFPNLIKTVASFCSYLVNKELIAEAMLEVLKQETNLQEFQLFWFCVILESNLLKTRYASDILSSLFYHPSATRITQARLLEIPDERFGLPELRNPYLATGQSDWLAWAAAVGTRAAHKSSRNYQLTYFANASPMNRLIRDVIVDMP